MMETKSTLSASENIEVIKEELLAVFRGALGRSDVKADEGFLVTGGDSLTVIETILDIEERYGVTLSAAEFMALDTAESLAQHIASQIEERKPKPGTEQESDARENALLSVVQDGDQPHPLICAYGLTGEAAYAITLVGLLPADQPAATLQIRTADELGKAARSLREIAKSSATKILKQYPHRSCVLLGYSLGAHVALAIGHELAQGGSPPALIAVLDDEADLDCRHFGALQRDIGPANISETLAYALQCSPAEPIATRLVYFRSAENEAYYRSDLTSGWGEIATGGVTHIDIGVNHHDIPTESGLRQIVPRLMEEIATPSLNAPRPGGEQNLRFEARRAAREGRLSNELAYLNQLIEQNSKQPSWLYANLAAALFQKGDTASAIAAMSKARLQEKWQLSLDLRFLDEIQRRGLEEERDDVLSRLSALKSDHPSVHEQKAKAYFKLGLLSECQLELRAGLTMQPGHLRLNRFFVRYLQRIKAWPELVERTEQLIEEFPEVRSFRTTLMLAYTKNGSPLQALRFHDAIRAQSQPHFQELIALGNALLHCSRSADALELADLAVRAAPSRSKAHVLRSKCLRLLGRRSEADLAKHQAADLRVNKAADGGALN